MFPRNTQTRQQYPPMRRGGFGNRDKGDYARGSSRPPTCYNCGEQGHV